MKALWKGSINFGLVSCPISLYVAHKTHDISFNQLCSCGGRIREKRFCERENIEVPYYKIQKGFYISKSHGYVVFTKEELEKLKTKSSKVIEIVNFVNADEIDDLYIEKAYYVLPDEKGLKAYFLLKEVLSLTNKVGVGKITLRNRESICLIKSYKNGLVLFLLYYPDEIIDFDELFNEQGIHKEDVKKDELELAKMLIEKLSNPFKIEDFKDSYTETLQNYIKAKIENREFKIEDKREETIEFKDLMEALKRSIEIKSKKVVKK
ncbi:MAG: Ku protein [Candidatus Bathyarchaeia archaeon]